MIRSVQPELAGLLDWMMRENKNRAGRWGWVLGLWCCWALAVDIRLANASISETTAAAGLAGINAAAPSNEAED